MTPAEPTDRAILRGHLEWARRHALVWLVLSLAVFAGAFWLFGAIEATEGERTAGLVVLAALILVNAVWHAAGLALARVESVILSRVGGTPSGETSR